MKPAVDTFRIAVVLALMSAGAQAQYAMTGMDAYSPTSALEMQAMGQMNTMAMQPQMMTNPMAMQSQMMPGQMSPMGMQSQMMPGMNPMAMQGGNTMAGGSMVPSGSGVYGGRQCACAGGTQTNYYCCSSAGSVPINLGLATLAAGVVAFLAL